MNKIVRNIPNSLTCANLLCGCLALVKAFEGDLVWAAYLVGIALVFDFLDGFLARLLKVTSPIGKDLDSLADMVTFGVVPGIIMYKLIQLLYYNQFVGDLAKDTVQVSENTMGLWVNENSDSFIVYSAFLIPVFSAIRLARFNNDKRQTDSFIGLPTPANAVFIVSLPLIVTNISGQECYLSLFNPYVLVLASCVLSLLLIAPLPLFALKFKSFGWKGNEIRFIFLGMAVILIACLQFVGIPLVIVLYILMSIINNIVNRPSKS